VFDPIVISLVIAIFAPQLFKLVQWVRRLRYRVRRQVRQVAPGAASNVVTFRARKKRPVPPQNASLVRRPEISGQEVEAVIKATSKAIRVLDELFSSRVTITDEQRQRLLKALAQLAGRLEQYAHQLESLKHAPEDEDSNSAAAPVVPVVSVAATKKIANQDSQQNAKNTSEQST